MTRYVPADYVSVPRNSAPHEASFEFRFPGTEERERVTVEGEYVPGYPATGFSGPPENYDPGDPARFEVESVLMEGIRMTWAAFEARVTEIHGNDAERVIYDLLDAAQLAFEAANPAPTPDYGPDPRRGLLRGL